MDNRDIWRRLLGMLLLLLTTFIWGTAFLAQKIGSTSLGPFAMTTSRNILGGTALLLVIILRRKNSLSEEAEEFRRSMRCGVICGLPLSAAMVAQQIGINDTSPGICAFLTTNYVLFVPIIVAVLHRRLPSLHVIIAATAALLGTYLICMQGGDFTTIGKGEAWTLLSSFIFAVHMIIAGKFAPRNDVMVMSMSQLFTAALITSPLLLLPSEIKLLAQLPSMACIASLVYLGVFSSGIATTLQFVAQKKMPASIAAVVLSMESVFGALSGWVAFGDVLSSRQLLGCALVFSAALGAQLISGRREK